jgi:HEAT repeat protein
MAGDLGGVSRLLKTFEKAPSACTDYGVALVHYAIESPVILNGLLNMLYDGSHRVQIHVAGVLAQIAYDLPVIVPALIDALKNANGGGREAAALALGEAAFVGRAAVPVLRPLAQDKSDALRRAALFALSRMAAWEGNELLPVFTTALADADPSVRSNALHSLCNLGEIATVALPHLRRLLSDPDETVRESAEETLGKMM